MDAQSALSESEGMTPRCPGGTVSRPTAGRRICKLFLSNSPKRLPLKVRVRDLLATVMFVNAVLLNFHLSRPVHSLQFSTRSDCNCALGWGMRASRRFPSSLASTVASLSVSMLLKTLAAPASASFKSIVPSLSVSSALSADELSAARAAK